MRLAFKLLLTATSPWAWFLSVFLVPLSYSLADYYYVSYRRELAEEIGIDRADHFAGLAAGYLTRTVKAYACFLVIPILLSNAAWVGYGFIALKKAQAIHSLLKPKPDDLA